MIIARLILTAFFLVISTTVFAVKSPAPAPMNPQHHIPQGLYITPQQAYAMVKKDDAILVDVRTPEEWMLIGYTPMAKIMLPSFLYDYSRMDPQTNRRSYHLVANENWLKQFEEKLFDLGGNEHSKIILMCRSMSERAEPLARWLDQYGYKNVYLLLGGFEGGIAQQGPQKGFRSVNGWKNSGLPWTYDIDPDKVYFKKYGVEF